MFYYKNWEKLCLEISKRNVLAVRALDLFENAVSEQFVLLKHDVECFPSKALRLAEIENSYGIKGSFYIHAHLLNKGNNLEVLNQIRKMGHEVSYHYDVLDSNNGNFESATKEFEENLQKFEQLGFKIKTVCQHGNPIKKRISMNKVNYSIPIQYHILQFQ